MVVEQLVDRGPRPRSTVTVSSALVAFGFAYFRFPLRNFFFGCVLATMMLPGVVTIVPTYLIWNKLTSPGRALPLPREEPVPALGAEPLRQRRSTSSCSGSSSSASRASSSKRRAWTATTTGRCSGGSRSAREARADRDGGVRVQGELDGAAEAAHLPARGRHVHVPRGLRSCSICTARRRAASGDYQVIIARTVLATLPMIIVFFLGQRYFVEGIATQGRKG